VGQDTNFSSTAPEIPSAEERQMALHSASLIDSGWLAISREPTHGLSVRHVGRSVFAALVLIAIIGCAARQMGTPIRADRPTESSPGSAVRPESPAASSVSPDLKQWDVLWARIEVDPMTGNWVDHFRICAIKYRFRKYDELFRCLDLFESRVTAMSAKDRDVQVLRQYSRVWTGWMRAGAYAELGSPDSSLNWATSAWLALPEEYRTAKPAEHGHFGPYGPNKAFYQMAERLAGGFSRWQLDAAKIGRDNPAALDMTAETVAMSLAAERAVSLAALGELDKARVALRELQAWEEINSFVVQAVPLLGIPYKFHEKLYKGRAELLSIGPVFALHEYGDVVRAYRAASADVASAQTAEQGGAGMRSWILFGFWPASAAYGIQHMMDVRAFATALEDVSDALIYAESLSRTGETAEARSMLDTILKLPEIRDMGSLYWAALYERGMIALADGDRDQAMSLLNQSVDAIEKTRSTISYEAAKIGFAGDKQTVYAALVGAYAQAGDWNDAFLIAERAKARALVDLLAQQRDLAPPASADDRVRELLADATTSGRTAGLPVDPDVVRNLSSAAASRTELSNAAPETASLVSVQAVPIANIASRLDAEDTLIDYYRVGDDLYAFVLSGATVKGFKLSAKGLDEEVRAFRAAIERREPEATERGRPLYERLIRPLRGELKGSQLTISPHGVLHYLPFAALPDGGEYLLDRFSVRLIPSADTLVYLKTNRPRKVGKVLALGNPDLGDPKFDLPNAQLEAVDVAAMFPASKALVRGEASKTAVKTLGSGFAILHFATHGTFNTDSPLASGLYLAKGSEASGLLTVSDLYTLRFDTDLVTLSACQTALGKVASGDDVIGLTRGFLYSGARSIVASLWEVNDAATEQLMLSFYRNLQDHTSRDALRIAQIETRAKYPHPMLWGAFQIVGRAD
jgi:CHAT domain-containing protein